MKKFILLVMLISGVASAQWFESYKFENDDGVISYISSGQSAIFDISGSEIQILFPDMTLKKYPYSKIKGNYVIYKGKGAYLYYDKKNKLLGSQGIGIWYLKEFK